MRSLLLALAFASILATNDGGLRTVAASETQLSGAAEGVFSSEATFAGLSLQGSTFAIGVVIRSDGVAVGQFQTVLLGTSIIGLPQSIALEGPITAGSVNADGTVTFSGLGHLDVGDGSIPTTVPFSATASSGGLQLTIGSTALAMQTLDLGSVSIR